VQRVTSASVTVAGEVVGEIGTGLLVLVGVTHTDTPAQAVALARKVAGLRVLRDELSVTDSPGAGVLVVSQFTLYGDARKGRRPTWAAAAPSRWWPRSSRSCADRAFPCRPGFSEPTCG
jgi:D-tyrosyl-tRNA(Tyr) deacylase